MTARTAARFPFTIFLLALFLAASPLFGQQTAQRSAAPSDKHVVVVSMDGMRPDVLLRAKIPNIRDLAQRGSFTFWAESTDLAITLPTHVSMLTGVTPAKHKVLWNDDRDVEPSMLAVPTLFDLAKKAGYSNAMVVGKRKLAIMAKPGMVDWLNSPEKKIKPDAVTVATAAAQILRQHRPSVMFVHFPDPDAVGHAVGWGSPAQVAIADKADQGVGIIVAALREARLSEKTLLIVTADHGGSGRSHGAKVPFSHYIPWIAVGPGVRENYDLTLEPKLAVHVEDVFATALNFLGVAVPLGVDGKPVLAIFGKAENAEPKRKK
ncbi:MAG: ectonucleotide pyrophosphatase/phosphodiesterase [Verrucomicrobia bacterium]|nr:ectonucleotide pyrophosphatase/phosphodiesterase [Verrucomicrobiota bacterium]